MSRTKDENFVIALYRKAKELNDVESILNRYEIGELAGLHPKAVDAICKLLVQANFIKKKGEEFIYLTDRGCQLAERLLYEN